MTRGPYLESLPVQWNELNSKDEKAKKKCIECHVLFVFMKGKVRYASNKYSNNRYHKIRKAISGMPDAIFQNNG